MQLMLRTMREARGLTQKELAEAIGSTLRKVSSWENSEVRIPLLDAARIADVFDCTLDELAGRTSRNSSAYPDPRQAELNRCWESLDQERQDRLIGTAHDMEAAKRAGRGSVQSQADAG